MKYTKLGKSDLEVSRICLGCMGFGNAATGQHSWTVVPHKLVGVMAQNTSSGNKKEQVWMKNAPKGMQ